MPEPSPPPYRFVESVGHPAPAAAVGTDPLADTATIITIAAIPALACVVGVVVWRRFIVLDPAERAFRSLARRMHLSRADIALLRRVAEAARVTPVRVLVGPVAFEEGARLLATTPNRPKPKAINALRARLFQTGPFRVDPNANADASAADLGLSDDLAPGDRSRQRPPPTYGQAA